VNLSLYDSCDFELQGLKDGANSSSGSSTEDVGLIKKVNQLVEDHIESYQSAFEEVGGVLRGPILPTTFTLWRRVAVRKL
jgi:hypothetical protein